MAWQFGVPLKETDKKPRLPMRVVYFENEYEQDENKIVTELEEYNRVIEQYYPNRTKGNVRETWSEQMAKMLERPSRMYMQEFVQSNKMNLK